MITKDSCGEGGYAVCRNGENVHVHFIVILHLGSYRHHRYDRRPVVVLLQAL